MPHDDGGPAFPLPERRDEYGNGICAENPGMTLRAWFAGQALAGLIAHYGDHSDACRNACRVADDMIEELKEKPDAP